eukprot:TRINITY_DN11947_c0_g1_i1.p1 TRINITY_DN11947_c0_g1~~TRINITY_DN11947_c0_g1_i1.p1  ORF type:complete len:222 (+),score=26.99 TRINITY_DN11947_c0_g1_i1:98-667(+)
MSGDDTELKRGLLPKILSPQFGSGLHAVVSHATENNCETGSLKNCRVLLVEDNKVNQRITKKLLDTFGCVVTVVEDGRQAVSIVQTEVFDGVLMDCNMPVMDGFAATQLIRTLEQQQTTKEGQPPYTRLPIVALTASDAEEYRRQCLQSGMDSCLTKPLRRATFLQVFTQSLGPWRSISRSPLVARKPI